MKKTFSFFSVIMLLVTMVATVSCTTKENQANSIVGTWECVASEATNPGTFWGSEASGGMTGQTISFKTEGSFKASTAKLVDFNASTGYWSLTDTSRRLYINSTNYWKIKEMSDTKLKLETYFVNGTDLTYDTAGVPIMNVNGPFVREFKRK